MAHQVNVKVMWNLFLFTFQWSPDGKIILFGIATGEIHIYDNMGNFIVSDILLVARILWGPAWNKC